MDNINVRLVNSLDISLTWIYTHGCGSINSCHCNPNNKENRWLSIQIWAIKRYPIIDWKMKMFFFLSNQKKTHYHLWFRGFVADLGGRSWALLSPAPYSSKKRSTFTPFFKQEKASLTQRQRSKMCFLYWVFSRDSKNLRLCWLVWLGTCLQVALHLPSHCGRTTWWCVESVLEAYRLRK